MKNRNMAKKKKAPLGVLYRSRVVEGEDGNSRVENTISFVNDELKPEILRTPQLIRPPAERTLHRKKYEDPVIGKEFNNTQEFKTGRMGVASYIGADRSLDGVQIAQQLATAAAQLQSDFKAHDVAVDKTKENDK